MMTYIPACQPFGRGFCHSSIRISAACSEAKTAFRFFFFSSRRRHTRSTRDWSSDVCSSDLTLYEAYALGGGDVRRALPRGKAPHQVSFFWRSAHLKCEAAVLGGFLKAFGVLPSEPDGSAVERSEERRVGKECRSRGCRYDGN